MSCSAGCRARWPGSGPSPPTPATSCVPRWRCSAASWSRPRAPPEAERLSHLTDDLLLLARSDEDRLSLRPAATDIGKLLARSAGTAGSRLAAAGVTCHVDAQDGMLADVDGDRIRQAVDNLLDNALWFAPRGSVIVLAAPHGPDLGIEVRDDGPGFPPGFLPHAFERFRRPDTSRSRDDGGTGLGLAIVRAIAVAHGGTASAANKPEGGGAVVRVRLPGVIDVPGKM